MQSEIHVIGVGAITAAGACSPVSAASVHAGLTHARLHERADGTVCHAAFVSSLPRALPRREKLRTLLASALLECGQVLPRVVDVAVFLSAPSAVALDELLAADVRVGQLQIVRRQLVPQASGLSAVQIAIAELTQGSVQLACVAGVDARTDEESLDALAHAGLLLVEGAAWGLIPSEGAGAVLLATERALAALALPSIARIRACSEHKDTSAQRGLPCIGQAQSRACHEVLDHLPGAVRVAEIFCDLNGERKRADEWSYTLSRVTMRCRDAVNVRMPALSWGDVGQATGALLVQLAAASLAAPHTHGPHALVWTAGVEGTRTALLLEAVAQTTAPLVASRARPVAQRTQDHAVLDEILSDASFLFEQRQYLLARRELASEAALAPQESVERRIEQQINALGFGATTAFERAVEQQREQGWLGMVYAAVRLGLAVASRTTAHEPLLRYLQTLTDQSEAVSFEVQCALAHGATADDRALIPSLFEAGALAFGLWLSADLVVPLAKRDVLARAAASAPAALGDSFPRALGKFGHVDDVPWLKPWLCDAARPRLQLAAALAYLKLERVAGRRYLLEHVEPVFLGPLALVCEHEEQTRLLAACERFADAPESASALALIGTPAAMACLQERLRSTQHAQQAARALYVLTGAELLHESEAVTVTPDDQLSSVERAARAAGDRAVGVEREQVRRFVCDADAWRSTCAALAHAQSRMRFGMPLTAAGDAALLVSPHIAPSLQRLCAESLLLRTAPKVSVRSDLRVSDQRALAESVAMAR
ncbi:MAG: hypothetical protein RL701_8064 [Pseudomonadota bacterium]